MEAPADILCYLFFYFNLITIGVRCYGQIIINHLFSTAQYLPTRTYLKCLFEFEIV